VRRGRFPDYSQRHEKLQAQISAWVCFIRRHLAELKRLRDAPGIESIDFRITYFWRQDVAALAYTLREKLHTALAHARAILTFCVYPCSSEEPTNQYSERARAPVADLNRSEK